MTERKVIEDSDEEDNEESTLPRPPATGLSGITLSTTVSLDGSPSHEIQEDITNSSTSSTGLSIPDIYILPLTAEADQSKELLNRELRAAHKSLLEPTPKSALSATRVYISTQQQTPTSPTPSPLKTKRSKTSVEKPKAKKPLKTYGESCQDIFEFHGSSDGEIDVMSRIHLGHKAEERKKNKKLGIDKAARRPITSSGGDTELLSTGPKPHETSSVGENDASMQSSMPRPASKFTSFEHSQRSETSMMPTITDPTPPKSVNNNVIPSAEAQHFDTHSDDRMPTLTRSSLDDVDEERFPGSAQRVKSHFTRSNEAIKAIGLQPTEEIAPSSSASEISPSKTITVKRMNQPNSVSHGHSSHLDVEHLPSQLHSNVPATVSPVVLLPAQIDTEGGQDELSLSVPEASSKSPIKPAKVSKRKRNVDDERVDELGSDDNGIGVPKEHYQPRPSKRRSGGGDEEIFIPKDFSKKPETIAKRKCKTKRHKTTAFQELLPKDEDEDEEVKVVPDCRFEIPEKKPPTTSPERDCSDVETNDHTEEARPEAQPESKQTTKATGQKKRGRPKKVVTNLSEETVADEAEADNDQDDTETEAPVISATVKKSRKKTKTKQTPMPIIDEQDRNDDCAPAAGGDLEDLPANILNETNGNSMPSKLGVKPLPKTSPVEANAAPETPRKSTTPTPKGPDKHSPISSGKVAYRVGLSKRARIAPLLRIVRK